MCAAIPLLVRTRSALRPCPFRFIHAPSRFRQRSFPLLTVPLHFSAALFPFCDCGFPAPYCGVTLFARSKARAERRKRKPANGRKAGHRRRYRFPSAPLRFTSASVPLPNCVLSVICLCPLRFTPAHSRFHSCGDSALHLFCGGGGAVLRAFAPHGFPAACFPRPFVT